MKSNPVKAALRAGRPQVGTWLSFGDVFTARLMARTGFPWLTVDLEHSPIDWQTASLMFATIADAGCVPLCRVPRGSHDLIKRALDGGAWGIVVPMVNTVEEAKLAIAAARYPPQGNRSIGGSIPAQNFQAPTGEYYRRANDEVLVILQTESPQGVENAEAIYGLPGVDAIFVGPNDLFWQMKQPDGAEPAPAEFEAMLQRVLAAGKKTGTPVGIHCMSIPEVQQRISEGWQFLALQSELKMMVTKAQELAQQLGLTASDDLARY
jgi:4-hydroxy-2-oxoheptanedioate aldolase